MIIKTINNEMLNCSISIASSLSPVNKIKFYNWNETGMFDEAGIIASSSFKNTSRYI